MDKAKLVSLLKDENPQDVERYANYLIKLATEKEKGKQDLKNPWMERRKEDALADLFLRVKGDGLVFDGVHITLSSRGIGYDYVAYKNKMLIAYPESIIDHQLVHEGEDFTVEKDSGKVVYKHVIKTPFARTAKNVIGGYCVIKNKRGESITMLNAADIDQCRKVALTDVIWQNWFTDMALKTVIKKACKLYYSDIFKSIDEKDNDNYDLEIPLTLEIEIKQAFDDCKTVDQLAAMYKKYKPMTKDVAAFNTYVAMRKRAINAENL
jgi:hypothetical protein